MGAAVVRTVAPDTAEVRRLIAQLDAYENALYPPSSVHLDDVATLSQPNVHFVGIEADGALVACGAAKRMDDAPPYGEIKRMFVLPAHRGRGHARRILRALEDDLQRRGIGIARLETGILQPEALSLYRALGYRECGPFGGYALDPWSLFMEKRLDGG